MPSIKVVPGSDGSRIGYHQVQDAFGPGARHFATQAELIQALTAAEQDKHTTILIKGSRSAVMENVVAALCGSSTEKH